MTRISDLPIRTKLLGLILLGSGITLLLAMVAILAYDAFSYADLKTRDMRSQAEILGRTGTVALIARDQIASRGYLEALQAKPSILAGAFYTSDGQLLASYHRHGSAHAFPVTVMPREWRDNDQIGLVYPVNNNGNLIGMVYLHAELDRASRLAEYAGVIILAGIASLLIGMWISNRLQRVVSAPLQEIAATANAIIDKKDYRLRAKKQGADEIGKLTDAFNAMLAHIEERDARLQAMNQLLLAEIDYRKQVEAALQRNMQALTRSNAELEQFAYVYSHDLQEPLRMVASYTQLLEKRYQDRLDEKGISFLHYIVDGAKRMQELIDDLLRFSRAGTHGKELQPTRIEHPLQAAISNLHAMMLFKSIAIHWDPLPVVMADPVQIMQLFQNLLSNAIKFSRNEKVHIEINVTAENDYWLFAVKDNGIGIDREHFERIFIIFQRLHARAEYPGSGIGLSICKKIIERHGGRIWVESEKDKGTTFYFTLRKGE